MSVEEVLINKYNNKQITLEKFIDSICEESCFYCCDLVEYYGVEEEETYEEFINRLEIETV